MYNSHSQNNGNNSLLYLKIDFCVASSRWEAFIRKGALDKTTLKWGRGVEVRIGSEGGH